MHGLLFYLRTVVLSGVLAMIPLGTSTAREAPSNCGRVGYNGNYTVFTNACDGASSAALTACTDT